MLARGQALLSEEAHDSCLLVAYPGNTENQNTCQFGYHFLILHCEDGCKRGINNTDDGAIS